MKNRASIIVGIKKLTTMSADAMRSAANAIEGGDVDSASVVAMLRSQADNTTNVGKSLLDECVDFFVDEVWGDEKR